MTGKLQFQFDFAQSGQARRRENPRQRILILGDYSGQNPGKPPLAGRKPLRIDIDRFDDLLDRLRPQLRLALEDGGTDETTLEFTGLDAFHPDVLYENLSLFQHLRQMRGRLENPSTYAAAAEELKHGQLSPATPKTTPQTPAPAATDGASLFDQLLGGPSTLGQQPAKIHADTVQSLIQRLVEPYLDKGVDLGQQKQFLSAIDDTITELMRKILHHPSFQALEAAWRGVSWLADRVEDSEDRPLYLLDVARQELAEDLLAAQSHAEQTALWRLLSDSSLGLPGGEPWSLVLGLHHFGEDAESLIVLELLGAVSARCGGVFVAGASPKLLSVDSLATKPDASDWEKPPESLAQAWHLLRRSPAAKFIGLALPRFMLRRPYGKKSDPTERFRFEEMPPRPDHEAYLWGNPALACAELIARSWQEDAGDLRDVQDIAYHTFDDGSGQAIKPCAEVYLNEKTAHTMLDAGLMPLLSVRNQNHALIPRLQSIAEPVSGLV